MKYTKDKLLDLLIEENHQARERMDRITSALEALNDTNILHAERIQTFDGTLKASSQSMSDIANVMRSTQKQNTKFLQILIFILVFVLVVIANAQRAFEYLPIIGGLL